MRQQSIAPVFKMPPLTTLDLEREIEVAILERDRHEDYAQPAIRTPALPMPDYVEHREGTTEIGKLSAEAIVKEYELAAQEIEAMGVELIARVKQCESMTIEALAVTEQMKATAARYREEGKRIFEQIEGCSLLTAEVRKACVEMQGKIATPTTVSS